MQRKPRTPASSASYTHTSSRTLLNALQQRNLRRTRHARLLHKLLEVLRLQEALSLLHRAELVHSQHIVTISAHREETVPPPTIPRLHRPHHIVHVLPPVVISNPVPHMYPRHMQTLLHTI